MATSSYAPMPVAVHLKRGYCCEAASQCKLCPYHGPRQAPPKPIKRASVPPDPKLAEYMQRAAAGETLTFYSDRSSLRPTVVIGENLTIVYCGGLIKDS